MNPRALHLIQHHAAEGPGDIAVWARSRGFMLQSCRADLGELPSFVDATPIVLLGGPYSAHAELPWLERERRWLSAAIAAGAPVFAICLGAQLLARALGGQVLPMGVPETGWQEVMLASGERLEFLQWHEDRFVPPPSGVWLGGNSACMAQMFGCGPHLGLQFHPEWNAASVEALHAAFGDDCALAPLEQTAAEAGRFAASAAWLVRALDAWVDGPVTAGTSR